MAVQQHDQRVPAENSPVLSAYAPGAGPDRYIRFCQDIYGLELADTQKRILRSIATKKKSLILSGNGVGKSYAVAGGAGAFLYANPDSTVNITSGTYSILDDTIWKPIKNLHDRAQEKWGLPGRYVENPPRLYTELDEEWFLKAISPTRPKNLEGRHNDFMLSIIEEADSDDITAEHLDSAESTLTDGRDRIVVIANPPEDSENIVNDLLDDDTWHTIQFSSFESRNVKVDAGKSNQPKIPGLVDLEKVRDDWKAWNDEPWPGVAQAKLSHLRDDLHTLWYKRRLGVVPPSGSTTFRPITSEEIDSAWNRRTLERGVSTSNAPVLRTETPQAIGIDVAREGGDQMVISALHGDVLEIPDKWSGLDHVENEQRVRRYLRGDGSGPHCPVIIDAQGEGSGIADRLKHDYDRVHRFNAGAVAMEEQKYRFCWGEGLHALGKFMRDGGVIDDQNLRDELYPTARIVDFSERYIGSRDTTVIEATSKSKIKADINRSPDYVDAAMQSIWGRECLPKKTVPSTWA